MSAYKIQEGTLTDIANAIRSKDGSATQMTPGQMATRINNIPGPPEMDPLSIINRTITSASDNSITSIGGYAFAYCYSLTTVNFPNCTVVNTGAFAYCSSLTTVNLPKITAVENATFRNCSSLTTLSLPATCTTIKGSTTFRSCWHLTTLRLTSTKVVTLASAASYVFSSTPFYGYSTKAGKWGSIYVPASLYATYKKATNWSAISARFSSY